MQEEMYHANGSVGDYTSNSLVVSYGHVQTSVTEQHQSSECIGLLRVDDSRYQSVLNPDRSETQTSTSVGHDPASSDSDTGYQTVALTMPDSSTPCQSTIDSGSSYLAAGVVNCMDMSVLGPPRSLPCIYADDTIQSSTV